jgi:mRNA-degrading endonuclease toxin of MazEF toxin-antitoxin module
MKWGEIYRTREKIKERGHKPGFYIVVSRDFIAGNDDISTVICAPVYGEVLGLRSEVVITAEDGVPRQSSVRCDFLTLMFKPRLTGFVGTLSEAKQIELKRALVHALQVE